MVASDGHDSRGQELLRQQIVEKRRHLAQTLKDFNARHPDLAALVMMDWGGEKPDEDAQLSSIAREMLMKDVPVLRRRARERAGNHRKQLERLSRQVQSVHVGGDVSDKAGKEWYSRGSWPEPDRMHLSAAKGTGPGHVRDPGVSKGSESPKASRYLNVGTEVVAVAKPTPNATPNAGVFRHASVHASDRAAQEMQYEAGGMCQAYPFQRRHLARQDSFQQSSRPRDTPPPQTTASRAFAQVAPSVSGSYEGAAANMISADANVASQRYHVFSGVDGANKRRRR